MRTKTLLMCCGLIMLQTAYGAATPPVKDAKAMPPTKTVLPDSQRSDPLPQVAVIDSVVAVVNDDVITRHELDDRVREVVRQLQKQDTTPVSYTHLRAHE